MEVALSDGKQGRSHGNSEYGRKMEAKFLADMLRGRKNCQNNGIKGSLDCGRIAIVIASFKRVE